MWDTRDALKDFRVYLLNIEMRDFNCHHGKVPHNAGRLATLALGYITTRYYSITAEYQRKKLQKRVKL